MMENRLWEKAYHLRASDFDAHHHIKPSAILELFQDAAGQHAECLGVGYDAMLSRAYLWVLVRIKFQILVQPKNYQSVKVKTWPLAPNRLNYRREYCIENQEGQGLIIGSSEWVVMHSERRRLVSDPDLYPFKDHFHEEMHFEAKLERVRDFETTGTPYTVQPTFSDLDANHHVNNTKYANYVMDALSPVESDEIDTFQIDFRREVLPGDLLSIHHQRENELSLLKGLNHQGELMFACQCRYKSREC